MQTSSSRCVVFGCVGSNTLAQHSEISHNGDVMHSKGGTIFTLVCVTFMFFFFFFTLSNLVGEANTHCACSKMTQGACVYVSKRSDNALSMFGILWYTLLFGILWLFMKALLGVIINVICNS